MRFQRLHGKIKQRRLCRFGSVKDSAKSHDKFIAKQELNFPLLMDEDIACTKHTELGEKSMYGRKYMGTSRSTFVIGQMAT